MAKKMIGPRITKSAAEWYAANFSSLNAGAAWTLDVFPMLFYCLTAEQLAMLREYGMLDKMMQ